MEAAIIAFHCASLSVNNWRLHYRDGHVFYRQQYELINIVVPGERQRVDRNYRQRWRHQRQVDAQVHLCD